MSNPLRLFVLLGLVALTLTVYAQSDGREADRSAIRAHIESICQAFIDGDIGKIRATHTEDWRGFLEGSRVPIKGIDEYMRANGIPWPQPADAPKGPSNPDAASRGFKVFDFDVHFYSPELAVACFNVDFGQKRIRSLPDAVAFALRQYAEMSFHHQDTETQSSTKL